MLTALTIHLFHVAKFFVAFLRVSQRAFWPKRFLCPLALFSAIQKIFTYLFISFWDRGPARATHMPVCGVLVRRLPGCAVACFF